MEDVWEDRGDETERRPMVIKTATDLQRLKLEKLMKHPDRPMIIPERVQERGVPAVPEFVRNVMGSSAGAGSGEFHVYRHLRRKEYARQKYMREKGERERLDEEYQNKLEDNKKKAEEKTAKKRAKRLKQKTRKKQKSHTTQKACKSESESDLGSTHSENEIVQAEEPEKHDISTNSTDKSDQEVSNVQEELSANTNSNEANTTDSEA